MRPILDERLVQAARDFAATRYPRGWAGAAAMYTASGTLLTSVYVDAPNPGGCLCFASNGSRSGDPTWM